MDGDLLSESIQNSDSKLCIVTANFFNQTIVLADNVPKHGTGNFIRHLRTKHGIEVVKKKLVSGEVFLSF